MALKGEPIDWQTFQLLPSLLDTLQSIRASDSETPGTEVAQNIQALISRLDQCSQILKGLPSEEFTQEEKDAKISKLQEKLKEKWFASSRPSHLII